MTNKTNVVAALALMATLGLGVSAVSAQEHTDRSGLSFQERMEAKATRYDNKLQSLVDSGRISAERAEEIRAKMAERMAIKLEIREAVLTGDYSAWQTLTADKEHARDIDEETFNKLSEAANLREAGDREGARAILKELDLKGSHNKFHKFGNGNRGELRNF